MDINEKMKRCFNDELLENKILTENEKKVLASLMYSYQICKEAKDNVIIRAMSELRKDIKISTNDMYDAIRNLESLYHMIERTAGESRGKEKSSIASQFKLNFDAILHPPKEYVRFDFTKIKKSSETSINTVDTDIVTDTVIDTDTNKETNINKESNIDNDINKEIDIVCDIDDDVVFENEIDNEKEITDNNNFDYSIYRDRSTWRKTLPDKMEYPDWEKETMIFELSQLNDYNSIKKKTGEILERLSRRSVKRQYFLEKAGFVLKEKCKELCIKIDSLFD